MFVWSKVQVQNIALFAKYMKPCTEVSMLTGPPPAHQSRRVNSFDLGFRLKGLSCIPTWMMANKFPKSPDMYYTSSSDSCLFILHSKKVQLIF